MYFQCSTSMGLFGDFFGTEIDWNGRKYKNKCKEWDYMYFVGFEICTKEKSVGISFTIRKPQVKYFWIALLNFEYWLRHYNIAVFIGSITNQGLNYLPHDICYVTSLHHAIEWV